MEYPLIKSYIDATNSHHFDNLIPLISSTAIYQFTNQTCQGIREIREYFENAWELVKDEVYSANDIRCIVDTQDIKIYVYEYHYQGFHQGKFVSGKGKATNVFQNFHGTWQLILEHLN